MPKGIPNDGERKKSVIKNKRYLKYKVAIGMMVEGKLSLTDIQRICKTSHNLDISLPTLSRIKKEFIDNIDR